MEEVTGPIGGTAMEEVTGPIGGGEEPGNADGIGRHR
jgi:hypothetical protein